MLVSAVAKLTSRVDKAVIGLVVGLVCMANVAGLALTVDVALARLESTADEACVSIPCHHPTTLSEADGPRSRLPIPSGLVCGNLPAIVRKATAVETTFTLTETPVIVP